MVLLLWSLLKKVMHSVTVQEVMDSGFPVSGGLEKVLLENK